MIESYVLGVADAQEAAELEQLRLQYPEVAAAIAECERWLAATAEANAVPVSEGVKDQLLTNLQQEFKTPPPEIINDGTLIRQMKLARTVAAAAMVLLVASAGINFYLYQQYNQAHKDYMALVAERNTVLADNGIYQTRLQHLQQQVQFLSDSGMLKIAMPGIKGKEDNLVTVFWDTRTKDVYVLANKLPKAPAGKQYQLWALVDGKPIDAGVLGNCADNLCRLKNVQKAQAFAITLEKAGGSPTPSLDQMFVMGAVRS